MVESLTIFLNEKFDININKFIIANNNHLFNEPIYFKLHSKSANDIYAQLVCRSNNKVFATIAFYFVDIDTYTSPNRGTFGGISLNQALEFAVLEKFVMTLWEYMKEKGARTVVIKCAPLSHNKSDFSVISNILMRHGFTMKYPEISYDLEVDNRSFIDRIDYSNVKRIRKLQREDFVAKEIDNSSWHEVYNVIEKNRLRLGVKVSMSKMQIQEMIDKFPNKIHFFGVINNKEKSILIASAICIALTESIMYVLYWGDIDGMSTYSPVVLVAQSIYEYCQKNNFKVMDAGTSTINGIPNFGLINFKRNLGLSESLKVDFTLMA